MSSSSLIAVRVASGGIGDVLDYTDGPIFHPFLYLCPLLCTFAIPNIRVIVYFSLPFEVYFSLPFEFELSYVVWFGHENEVELMMP